MKALTLWQPWAWWVASGQKPIENRPWKPPAKSINDIIAIHAGATFDKDAADFLDRAGKASSVDDSGARIHGAILGFARVVGYVEKGQLQPDPALRSFWFFGPFGWKLEDITQLATPVPCKGALGLWQIQEITASTIERQLQCCARMNRVDAKDESVAAGTLVCPDHGTTHDLSRYWRLAELRRGTTRC